jgi:hypothetical protein
MPKEHERSKQQTGVFPHVRSSLIHLFSGGFSPHFL